MNKFFFQGKEYAVINGLCYEVDGCCVGIDAHGALAEEAKKYGFTGNIIDKIGDQLYYGRQPKAV